MKQSLLEAQLANAYKRFLISGGGIIVLTSLYYLGFQGIAASSIGLPLFNAFVVFNILNGFFQLALGAFKTRLNPHLFLTLYYILISFGSLSWAVSGLFLEWFSSQHPNPAPEFQDLIKIQFFMIIGILNAIPQFFRHAKNYFIWNLSALYIGLLSLVPLYFQNQQSVIFASLIILLFSMIVTPQYLVNWKAEIQRIEHEKDLQEIIDGFPGAVSEIHNGRYQRVNRYIKQKIFGPQVGDLTWLAQPIGFFHGDVDWVRDVKNFEQSNKTHHIAEYKLQTVDGERYFLSLFSKLRNANTLVASVDIHDLVIARQELDAQKLEAQNKARLASLGLMAAGIAHEINNPLAVIQSRADMIRRRLSKLDAPEAKEALESLNRIFPMVKRITQIINSMRSLTRDSSQDDFEQVTISMILEDITLLIDEKLKNLCIEFSFTGNALNEPFLGKKGELAQVFINAINNSIQAIQGLDQKWIRVIANTKDESHLKIEIQDSGHGIPEMYRDKIMTPLFTTKPPGDGTGLGLAISRKIIEIHKGEIYFDHSKPNTTLVIELPKTQTLTEST